MRYFLLTLTILFMAFPALADEPAAQDGAGFDRKLELAGKMHEIWPIRTRIESAITTVAENFPEERQAEVKAAIRRSIQYAQIEEASIRAMADIFTEEELAEMIAFYGSDAGRSVSAKTADYEAALRPVFVQMLDKAMLDLRTGQ
ncbi:MAG: DUF2059 domain-containing protein [Micavibrio sp.]